MASSPSASTHVSFVPAALRRVHDQRPLAQRHAGEAARHEIHGASRQHVRTQIDVARSDAGRDERRAGRQRQRRLRDVLVRTREDPPPELLALGCRRGRPDQHAVAARAMDLLDDELVQMVEHVVALLRAT